jgi:endonuclease-8
MSEGDAIHRAASALRTALAAKPMVRFDAPRLVGPAPRAGRMVERVETHGRHIELVWDDNMVLHTNLRMSGTWHVYRRGEHWRRPSQQMCVAIEVADWVAVCFNAPMVETYRIPDKRRHPGMGRLGPDLCQPGTDLSVIVNLLLSYDDGAARLGDVLLDQRVLRGLGNVYRCEVLWATELSPFARVDSLNEHNAIRLINTAASLLRANMQQAERAAATAAKGGLEVYGRNGQRCGRCGETIDCRQTGEQQRVLYWCRGCQQHLDPNQSERSDETPMDPHPAAQAYLAGLPWNRDAV